MHGTMERKNSGAAYAGRRYQRKARAPAELEIIQAMQGRSRKVYSPCAGGPFFRGRGDMMTDFAWV